MIHIQVEKHPIPEGVLLKIINLPFSYRVAFLECKLEAMLCLVRPEKSGSEPQMCGRNFEKCIGDALGKKWNSMIHLLLWLFCSNT